jgi:hypothetical protein
LLSPWRSSELLAVLAHDRGGRSEANTDGAALVDEGTLCGDPPDDILGCQYRRHHCYLDLRDRSLHPRIRTRSWSGLSLYRQRPFSFSGMIPEIDIWRAAQLMLKRYGDNAFNESVARADELAAADDQNGAATWRRIATAVKQLANTIPPGPVH